MEAKEEEKFEKHQDIAREVRKMWAIRTRVVLVVVVGALGTIPSNLKGIGMETSLHCQGNIAAAEFVAAILVIPSALTV